jgi:hypothetical protein
MKNGIITIVIWGLLSMGSYAGDLDANTLISAEINRAVDSAHKSQEAVMRELISQEYLNIAQKLEAHFKKPASVVSDFNFYTIVAIDKIIIKDKVAFVEASVIFSPDYLKKHPASDQKGNVSLWDNWGGVSLAPSYVGSNGRGLVTYYLVMQHDLWKIHESRFTSEPLSDGALDAVTSNMKTLVH